jgi:hypothetical protein
VSLLLSESAAVAVAGLSFVERKLAMQGNSAPPRLLTGVHLNNLGVATRALRLELSGDPSALSNNPLD